MEVQIQQEICPPPDSLTFADVDSKLLRWIEAEQAIVKVVNGWDCHKDDVQKQRKGRRYLLEKHEAAFEQLRNSSDSPYKAVPFEMELKKTW